MPGFMWILAAASVGGLLGMVAYNQEKQYRKTEENTQRTLKALESIAESLKKVAES